MADISLGTLTPDEQVIWDSTPVGGRYDAVWKHRASRASKDNINHPEHYKAGGIETIDFIQYGGFNSFTLGNAIKYISRAGKKTADPREDLKKALWYIRRAIDDGDVVSRVRGSAPTVEAFATAKGLSDDLYRALVALQDGLFGVAIILINNELAEHERRT